MSAGPLSPRPHNLPDQMVYSLPHFQPLTDVKKLSWLPTSFQWSKDTSQPACYRPRTPDRPDEESVPVFEYDIMDNGMKCLQLADSEPAKQLRGIDSLSKWYQYAATGDHFDAPRSAILESSISVSFSDHENVLLPDYHQHQCCCGAEDQHQSRPKFRRFDSEETLCGSPNSCLAASTPPALADDTDSAGDDIEVLVLDAGSALDGDQRPLHLEAAPETDIACPVNTSKTPHRSRRSAKLLRRRRLRRGSPPSAGSDSDVNAARQRGRRPNPKPRPIQPRPKPDAASNADSLHPASNLPPQALSPLRPRPRPISQAGPQPDPSSPPSPLLLARDSSPDPAPRPRSPSPIFPMDDVLHGSGPRPPSPPFPDDSPSPTPRPRSPSPIFPMDRPASPRPRPPSPPIPGFTLPAANGFPRPPIGPAPRPAPPPPDPKPKRHPASPPPEPMKPTCPRPGGGPFFSKLTKDEGKRGRYGPPPNPPPNKPLPPVPRPKRFSSGGGEPRPPTPHPDAPGPDSDGGGEPRPPTPHPDGPGPGSDVLAALAVAESGGGEPRPPTPHPDGPGPGSDLIPLLVC